MSEWIVSKFGGSSVRDAEAMKRCAAIVENNSQIKVVIISATYQTTNHLEEIANLALKKDLEACAQKILAMEERHLRLASELLAPTPVRNHVRELCTEVRQLCQSIAASDELSDATMDQIYSVGERLSSRIFAHLLTTQLKDQRRVAFKDARTVLRTDSHFKRAEPQIEQTRELVQSLWQKELAGPDLIVTQGFIGSTASGLTTTLGREGSDYSATLFGEAIGAKLVQIWTDVCGIATGDPRHVEDSRYLAHLSYEEATLMAENGAKVLFERTLAPAERSGMEVFVGSSLTPTATGTHIGKRADEVLGPKGVAFDPQTKLLTVVGLGLEADSELLSALGKLGGSWKSTRSLIQRSEATYQDFKDVHAFIVSSLK